MGDEPRDISARRDEASDHPSEHLALIEQWAVGDLSDEAPEVRRLEADCEACRTRIGQLRAVRAALDESAALEQAVLAEALGDASPSTQAHDRFRAAGSLTWWRRPAVIGVAAGFLIIIGGLLFFRPPAPTPSPQPPPVLLGSRLAPEHPVGATSDYGEFSWTDFGATSGVAYTVVVFTADGGEEIARAERLTTPTWRPDDTAAWPDRIRWEVTVVDVIDGDTLDSAGASARRGP